jgi:hypothetical protein
MKIRAVVETPYYDWNDRKYIEFRIENKVTRVKVPFRYGRVMCRTEGLKTVQELQKGDHVDIELQKKVWDGVEHWVIFSLRT